MIKSSGVMVISQSVLAVIQLANTINQMAKDAEGPRKSDFLAVPSDTYQRITSRLSQQQRQPITQNSSSEELEETLRTLQSYLEESILVRDSYPLPL